MKECLSTLQISFDVIAISETWFQKDNAESLKIINFISYYTNRIDNKRGGGVAIYVNEALNSSLIKEKSIAIDAICEIVTVELLLPKL